jgi:hypothetical protein
LSIICISIILLGVSKTTLTTAVHRAMLRSLRKIRFWIIVFLTLGVGAPSLCPCPLVNAVRRTIKFETGKYYLSNLCRCSAVQDRHQKLMVARCRRYCMPSDCVLSEEQSNYQNDHLERCLANAVLYEAGSKHLGLIRDCEDTVSLSHSALTLRAQHICMQV